VIVGGGLSGLAIAFDLVARGFDPTVLEASERPGGRICTIRAPFPDGLYVEAGATHVVADPALLSLMKAVGTEIVPRKPRPKGLSRVFLRGDKRIVVPPDGEEPEEYPLSAEEKALGFVGGMEKYFAPVKGVDPTAPLPATLLAYDAMDAATYLTKQGASPGYLRSIAGAFAPDQPLDRVSALSLMREVCNFFREIALPPGGGRVAGGSDRFPAAIAERLGKRVIYGAKVVRIERTAASVRVIFTARGQNGSIEAERAAIALPSTVLREIEVAPALSPEKARALKELTMVSVTRVYMGAKTRFWAAAGEAGTVQSDQPLGIVKDETELQDGTAGVLGLYVTGAEAMRLAAMSEEERIRTAVAYAGRAHPGLAEQLVGSASKCWDNEPLARGAYARFAPNQLTTLVPELAKPDGRLHFAGDQTSYRPGFMHGAVASARRVVEEIVRAAG
jgi:monoamine oxidase